MFAEYYVDNERCAKYIFSCRNSVKSHISNPCFGMLCLHISFIAWSLINASGGTWKYSLEFPTRFGNMGKLFALENFDRFESMNEGHATTKNEIRKANSYIIYFASWATCVPFAMVPLFYDENIINHESPISLVRSTEYLPVIF